jgi:lysophospholipase L1-like esterase
MFRISSLVLALALGLLTTVAAADPPPASGRFAPEIDAFAAADAASPPPACPLLFVGSSSIRRWTTLAHDLPDYPVLNRGFGGAEISDINANFGRVVGAYHPRAIVFYAGDNDLHDGKTPEEVVADFNRFMALKRAVLRHTRVYFVTIKPSKARLGEYPAQEAVNQAVKAMTLTQHDLIEIDVVGDMMADGKPKDIFVDDGLHLTPAGYAIWTQDIRRVLDWTGARKLSCASERKGK